MKELKCRVLPAPCHTSPEGLWLLQERLVRRCSIQRNTLVHSLLQLFAAVNNVAVVATAFCGEIGVAEALNREVELEKSKGETRG